MMCLTPASKSFGDAGANGAIPHEAKPTAQFKIFAARGAMQG